MAEPTINTVPGQLLVKWAASDMRPLQEFGYDTVAEAVEAIEGQAVPDVEDLADALHDAMCDVSHHDRPPARCSRWAKYPNLAQSVHDRLERMARG